MLYETLLHFRNSSSYSFISCEYGLHKKLWRKTFFTMLNPCRVLECSTNSSATKGIPSELKTTISPPYHSNLEKPVAKRNSSTSLEVSNIDFSPSPAYV